MCAAGEIRQRERDVRVASGAVTTTPASIPDGLVVELSRARVLPGASAEADRWMAMLNERLDECVATLDRERMAIEIVFRLKENDEDYLFWVSVHGPDGGTPDPDNALDRDHIEQAKRTIAPPGWTDATPQVLMLPDPVRDAVLSWASGDQPRGGQQA
jgi:Family of unknown function (DUF6176)